MTCKHHAQLTKDIPDYVTQFGTSSFKDLCGFFLGQPVAQVDREGLRLRLKRLVENGQLTASGFRDSRRWDIPSRQAKPTALT